MACTLPRGPVKRIRLRTRGQEFDCERDKPDQASTWRTAVPCKGVARNDLHPLSARKVSIEAFAPSRLHWRLMDRDSVIAAVCTGIDQTRVTQRSHTTLAGTAITALLTSTMFAVNWCSSGMAVLLTSTMFGGLAVTGALWFLMHLSVKKNLKVQNELLQRAIAHVGDLPVSFKAEDLRPNADLKRRSLCYVIATVAALAILFVVGYVIWCKPDQPKDLWVPQSVAQVQRLALDHQKEINRRTLVATRSAAIQGVNAIDSVGTNLVSEVLATMDEKDRTRLPGSARTIWQGLVEDWRIDGSAVHPWKMADIEELLRAREYVSLLTRDSEP